MFKVIEKIFKDMGNRLEHIREEEDKTDEVCDNEDYADGEGPDLSRLQPQSTLEAPESNEKMAKPWSKYKPRKFITDLVSATGFAGTSLRLLPNVRDTKIDLGEEHS
jgi:hypothetical protein